MDLALGSRGKHTHTYVRAHTHTHIFREQTEKYNNPGLRRDSIKLTNLLATRNNYQIPQMLLTLIWTDIDQKLDFITTDVSQMHITDRACTFASVKTGYEFLVRLHIP
jgi:hypothetical protein